MAVMTLCYETRMTYLDKQAAPAPVVVEDEVKYPTQQQLDLFYEHLEKTLNETGFIIKQHPGIVMTRLRRLFTRARPEDQELNILRGILSSIDRSIKDASKTNS
jgi:tRNA (cytidine32/uridine32-2'-O)-methyltransferase